MFIALHVHFAAAAAGGLFWIQPWNNMQYVATTSFLLTVAYDYYTNAGKTLSHCTSSVQNSELLAAATSQVKYTILLSFMHEVPMKQQLLADRSRIVGFSCV
jgi:hypothetical protein